MATGLIATVVVLVVLSATPVGRRLLFVGTGRTVAELSGLNVRRLRVGAFVGAGLTAAVLVPAFGNHGLWLTFLIFLAGRAAILALIYRRVERVTPFVPA